MRNFAQRPGFTHLGIPALHNTVSQDADAGEQRTPGPR
jgi:hypothetical protein